MSNSRQDFGLAARTAKSVRFTLTDGVNALPLTGATMLWKLSNSLSGEAILTKTETSGITILDATNGIVSLQIGDSDITEGGLYWHSLDVTPFNGQKTRCSSGRVVVDPTAAPAS